MPLDEVLNEVNRRLQEQGRALISQRRMQAIARDRHDRLGVGRQVGTMKIWLFLPEEIDKLIPGDVGRPS